MNRPNRLLLVVLFTALALSACGGVDVSTTDGGTSSSSLTSCVHKDTRCTQSCSTCH